LAGVRQRKCRAALAREPGKRNFMTREDIRDSQFEHKPPSRNLACAACGKPITHQTGRRPRFCSDRCRYREKGRGRVRKAGLGPNTGAAPKLHKKSNDFKALQRAKMLSSYRIFGPADVLAIEALNRAWRPTVSSNGVAIMVGRLRARVLV
jgi:predicted nucleic acid-binding Zn ribbon protein